MWDYDYNDIGQRVQVTAPNGIVSAYGYDDRNRMTKIEHKDGGTVVDGFTYALDPQGEITRVTDQDGGYWDYGYDNRYRLTKAYRNNSGASLVGKYEYTYDAGDNLVTKVTPFLDDFNDGAGKSPLEGGAGGCYCVLLHPPVAIFAGVPDSRVCGVHSCILLHPPSPPSRGDGRRTERVERVYGEQREFERCRGVLPLADGFRCDHSVPLR